MTSEIPDVDAKDQEVSLTQKDYVPTPYRASLWEGSDTFDRSPAFRAINLEVLVNEGFAYDPMFERFDADFIRTQIAGANDGEDVVVEPKISEEMIAEIRAQAYEEGRLEGIKEGALEAQAGIAENYETLSNSLSSITNSLREELENRIAELENKAVSLALDISKRILDTTTELKPEYILSVIRKAFIELGTQKGLVIRVSHQDYEFLEVVGLPEDLMSEQSKIRYVADERVTSGCIVETEYGTVNLELEHMWNEVKDKIYSSIKE